MLTARCELQTIVWCCQVELLVSSEFSALFNRGAASADGQCLRPSIRVRTCTEPETQPESWHLQPPPSMWWELSPWHRYCTSDRCPWMENKRLSQPKAFPKLKHKTGTCKEIYSLTIIAYVPRWPMPSTAPGVPPSPQLPAGWWSLWPPARTARCYTLAHLTSPSCQFSLCCSQFQMFQKSDHLCKTEQYFWHAEDKSVLHLMMRFSYNYHRKAVLLVF